MKYGWNGKNNILQISLCTILLWCIGGCGDAEPQKPGDGFYTYSGYRDWYRVPLIFPYQLMMIDDLDYASIEKYDPSKLLTESGSTQNLCSDVIQIRPAKEFVAFRRDTKFAAGEPLGILIYGADKIHYFKKESELSAFMKQHYPSANFSQWESTKEYYDRMWEMLNSQKKKQ